MLVASPDVSCVYCAEVGPAVAVFHSAVVSSLGSLLARVSAVAAISISTNVSSVTDASNASRLY